MCPLQVSDPERPGCLAGWLLVMHGYPVELGLWGG